MPQIWHSLITLSVSNSITQRKLRKKSISQSIAHVLYPRIVPQTFRNSLIQVRILFCQFIFIVLMGYQRLVVGATRTIQRWEVFVRLRGICLHRANKPRFRKKESLCFEAITECWRTRHRQSHERPFPKASICPNFSSVGCLLDFYKRTKKFILNANFEASFRKWREKIFRFCFIPVFERTTKQPARL